MTMTYDLLDGNLGPGIDADTYAQLLQTEIDRAGLDLQVRVVRNTEGIANRHLDDDTREHVQHLSDRVHNNYPVA